MAFCDNISIYVYESDMHLFWFLLDQQRSREIIRIKRSEYINLVTHLKYMTYTNNGIHIHIDTQISIENVNLSEDKHYYFGGTKRNIIVNFGKIRLKYIIKSIMKKKTKKKSCRLILNDSHSVGGIITNHPYYNQSHMKKTFYLGFFFILYRMNLSHIMLIYISIRVIVTQYQRHAHTHTQKKTN